MKIPCECGCGELINSVCVNGNPKRFAQWHYSRKIKGTGDSLALWPEIVKRRDGNKCVVCGSTQNLHAHHIKPKSKHPELEQDIDNGMTLCQVCHKDAHMTENPLISKRLVRLLRRVCQSTGKEIGELIEAAIVTHLSGLGVEKQDNEKLDPIDYEGNPPLKMKTYRMPLETKEQIKELRKRWGVESDARVIAMAVDRAAQKERGKE